MVFDATPKTENVTVCAMHDWNDEIKFPFLDGTLNGTVAIWERTPSQAFDGLDVVTQKKFVVSVNGNRISRTGTQEYKSQ